MGSLAIRLGQRTMSQSPVYKISAYECELMCLSIVVPQASSKSLAWHLSSKSPLTFHASSPLNFLVKCEAGYEVHRASLTGEQCHIVAMSKRLGFIPCVSQRGLYQHLRQHHTTPLLLEWMPEVGAELLRIGKLKRITAVGCEPGMLCITTKELDAIVCGLVKNGKLRWP